MRVRDIMTREPVCCSEKDSPQNAASLMRQSDTGVLPVVEDLSSRKLVGIITDRDLCLTIVADGADAGRGTVLQYMTPDPACCSPEDTAEHVLQLLCGRQVRRLPVVDGEGKLVGIVSLTDLARYRAITEHKLLLAISRICEPTSMAEAEARHRGNVSSPVRSR